MILLLLACSGDLSNEVFIEDAAFREALPHPDDVALAWPVDIELDEDSASMLQLTVEGLSAVLAWGERFVVATADTAAYAPTERGEDYRAWGPEPWDDVPGWFLRAELSRTRDGALYGFGIAASETSLGPWTEFVSGTWRPEPQEGEDWRGEATWQVSQLSGGEGGVVNLRYGSGADDTLVLELSSEGVEEADREYRVEQAEDLSGVLIYRSQEDFIDSADERRERILLLSQWDAEGAGRVDARLAGGDLGLTQIDLSQCWGADGRLTWQGAASELSWWPEQGEASDCPAGIEPADLDAL